MSDFKILIVTDEASLFERMRSYLAENAPDIEVVSAISGPRAIGVATMQRPAVIIVDVELTGGDGYALTRQLCSLPALSEVPVIALSTEPSEASAQRAREAGAAASMSKSIDPAVLLDKVRALHCRGTSSPASAEVAPLEVAPLEVAPLEAAPLDLDLEPEPSVTPEVAAAGYGVLQPTAEDLSETTDAVLEELDLISSSLLAAPEAAPLMPAPAPVMSHAELTRTSSAPPASSAPNVDELLRHMIDVGGSDLHVTVGSPPGIRLRGDIIPMEGIKPLSPKDTQEMLLSMLSEEQRRRFETELELDFAYSIPGLSRFRANVFQQRNSMGAVFRVIPLRIPTMQELNLPKVCKYLAERPRGLVLVTGPTGSGKSTTLAAMVDHINENRQCHIITLEDPIEFMHRNKKAYVNQREVGEDTHSFASALKRVLRQDPDVILVGEMRDLETISAAITAAETGHLVLATLHTTGGPETVDRIIDVFPPHQQQQVRMQLSATLEGVLSQVLLRSTDGKSRVMAMEIMLGVPAISNLIREGKTHQMPTIIQAGQGSGMQTLDQHLKVLLQAGRVTFEEAIGKAKEPRELAAMLGRRL